MPDLDPLPRRPGVPVFEPGDYGDVVGRAKHRRRRHLGAAGAGVAGLVAVVALTAGGPAGTFGLEPAPPAAGVTTPPSGSPEPAGQGPTSEPTTRPAGPGGEPGAHPTGTADPGDPEPGRPTVPTGDPHLPARMAPVVHRDDVAYDSTMVCDSDPGVVMAAGWCLHYDGPAQVRVSDVHEYRILACRRVGRGGATVGFETTQQVEFTVRSNDRDEWHWSGGHAFPKTPTRVRIEEERCARWTVTWDTTGDDGDPLPPGAYRMQPDLLVSDWGNDSSVAYTSMVYSSSHALDVVE